MLSESNASIRKDKYDLLQQNALLPDKFGTKMRKTRTSKDT